MKKLFLILSVCIFALSANAQSTCTLDKNHARLSFSVLHFGISYIEGNFKIFNATFISTKEDFSDARIELTAEVNSINTEVDMRDNDLKSQNWFDADKYPALTFSSTSFNKISGKNYKLKGNITIHGVTNPIEFDVVFNGKGENPMSKKYSYGFTISGILNRNNFGIGGEPLATGVANEIQLKSNVEFSIN
jgi:polyisoprenoid-binding protein YceI